MGVRNTLNAGWFNDKPAVIINVTQEPGSNVIETIDGVKAALPEIQKLLPEGVDMEIMSDRSETIRASVLDLEHMLAISIGLVTMSCFSPARNGVDASRGNNRTAFTGGHFRRHVGCRLFDRQPVANGHHDSSGLRHRRCHRHDRECSPQHESGMSRLEAALAGTRQIGFTVVSITLSLIAAFIPLIFMPALSGACSANFH